MRTILTAEIERRVKGPDRLLSVCRSQAWRTGKQAFIRQKSTSDTGLIRVSFVEDSIGEAADGVVDIDVVDGGGPRREYFRLLLKDIVNGSGLFTGKLIDNYICTGVKPQLPTETAIDFQRCRSNVKVTGSRSI